MPRKIADPDERTIEFAAKVPRTLYYRFSGLFPQHGSIVWFIRTSLETFLEKVENDPEAIERIKQSIDDVVRNA